MVSDIQIKLIWNLEATRRTLRGSGSQHDETAATIILYGLRVAAAAGSHFGPVGFGANVAERWRLLKRVSKNVGAEVNRTLDELSQQFNIPSLAHHPDFLVLEQALSDAISTLDLIDIRIDSPTDLLEVSDALEGYVESRVSSSKSSPLETANALNMLLASFLVSNSRGVTSVYDPSCSFGGTLIALHSVLREKGRAQGVRFYGQDVRSEAVAVAAWRFLLRGVPDFELEVGDTLLDPRFIKRGELKRFDVVVSAPPFYPVVAKDFDKTDPFHRFHYGAVKGSRADYAFVQHVLASTASGGRAAIVLAPTVLSRSGYEEEIRRRLIQADMLETVIYIPGTVGLSGSKTFPLASALIFDLAKPVELRDSVFFIDTSSVATVTESKSMLTPDVLDKLAHIYALKSEHPDVSSRAYLDDIRVRDYSFLPQLYIPQAPPTLTDLDTLETRIGELNRELEETLGAFDAALLSIRDS